MDRRTAIIGATGLIGTHLAAKTVKAEPVEATSIPQIPDAIIAFGEVAPSGIWKSYTTPIPDEAIILGYQFIGHQFWPMSYRSSYASGFSIQSGMNLFSTGPANIWYRLPDEKFWTKDWYQYHVDIFNNNVNEEFDHDG